MPPKRKMLRCHSDERCTHQPCTNPHVVLQPFMREESTRKKYCFTSLPASAALFNKPEMSDLRLRVQPVNELYHVHRAILCAASEVFGTMLGGSWAESRKDELELHEEADCANVFDIFLYFLYSGSVAIQDDFVVPLFLLAGKYNVRTLTDECAKVIERALQVFVLYDTERPNNNNVGTSSDPLQYQLTDSSSSSSDSSAPDLTDLSDLSDSDVAEMPQQQQQQQQHLQWPPVAAAAARHRSKYSRTPSSSSAAAACGGGGERRIRLPPSRKTHMIPSETFALSAVLRLLERCHGNEHIRRAALFNLEARVSSQILSRNYSNTWLDLNVDIVKAIMADTRFGYPESRLFAAVEAWLLAQPERWQSQETCSAVLRCIRYPLLSVRELYDVERNSLVQSNPDASSLVHEAIRYQLFYHCSTAEDRARWTGIQFKGRVIPNF